MRRRQAPRNVRALREKVRELVVIVHYATALGGTDPGWCGYQQLDEVAAKLGLPELPPMAELTEQPALIDAWADDCGVGR